MPADPRQAWRRVGGLMGPVGLTATSPPSPLARGMRDLLRAAESILAVDGIGVLLLDEAERLRSVASSGPVAATVEAAQEQLGVGPGIDTQRLATTVTVCDLMADERYPTLAAAVSASGVGAILSAPVFVNGALAGNLNAMRLGPGAWTTEEISAAETYAGVVASLLELDASTVRHARTSVTEVGWSGP